LDAPVKRISCAEAPMPYAKNLEELAALPTFRKNHRGGQGSLLFVMEIRKKNYQYFE
jgi:hypothetical protein